MGLRIKTNISSLKGVHRLSEVTRQTQNSMEQLSTGYRVNKAADDAAGLSISETLRAHIRSSEQARRNANDGVSMIQVAEGSFSEITNILVRLRELATQAASDTVGNLERSYANKEYTQLVDEIDRIANTTEYNGHKLLKGEAANNDIDELAIHIGIGDASFPNTDDIRLNIEEIKIDLEDNMPMETSAEIGPENIGDDFTREEAAEKITEIDNHLALVANNRAYLGSKQNRLYSAIRNIGIQIENMNSTKSQIKDVDFAQETAHLTQLQIIQNAGVSTLSQSNKWPELVMTLLR